MNREYSLDTTRQAAVEDLINMITAAFPTASFKVEPGVDEPDATHIIAEVDIDDADEVMDLVIDRLLEYQIDKGIPVYVIPTRTPERIAALLRQNGARQKAAVQS